MSNAKNKMKSTWSIIKTVTRSKVNVNNISLIHVNDNLTNSNQMKVTALDKYFLTVTENITVENLNDKNSVLNNTCIYAFKQLFQNIRLKYITTNEIEEIAKSLKIKNSQGYDGISTKNSKIQHVI